VSSRTANQSREPDCDCFEALLRRRHSMMTRLPGKRSWYVSYNLSRKTTKPLALSAVQHGGGPSRF